jgi:hypothetical protein
MVHFFHRFSEISGRRDGPFSTMQRDFAKFDPHGDRAAWKKENAYISEYNHETGEWEEFAFDGDLHEAANQLHRYQLVILSNFLTTPPVLARFRENVRRMLADQRPGNVTAVMGATGHDYPLIYKEVDDIAALHGHVKVTDVTFDGAARAPYFAQLERFGTAVRDYLTAIAGGVAFERAPKTWYPGDPLTHVPSFSLRAYRKGQR